VTNGHNGVWSPQINHRGDVVWVGSDGLSYDIFLYNYSKGNMTCLTEGEEDVRSPKINCNGNVVWQGYDGHDWEIFLSQATSVEIDIKPGSITNSINLKSRGVVPVAVLTSESFDARTVLLNSVRCCGASPARWMITDVDSDGDKDLLIHFRTQSLVELNTNSTEAILTGETLDGLQFEGRDSIKIVPEGNRRKK
jgi:hypothetical protein